MKLIKPNVEIWEQYPGIEGMLRHIERCARTCYKSEDKIGEGTAEKMVEMLKKNEHTAMLEHGTVYLRYSGIKKEVLSWVEKYLLNPYARVTFGEDIRVDGAIVKEAFVTTNLRVIYENNLEEDLQYLYELTKHHEKRITAHFVCDRGIMAELTRHRIFSFSVESTRYCNYSKDKFGSELTFIIPCWLKEEDVTDALGIIQTNSLVMDGPFESIEFVACCKNSEEYYLRMMKHYGWTPQQARAVLPNALKTEVCMTGFVSDWKHFFKLRCDKAAHPQMRELALILESKLEM